MKKKDEPAVLVIGTATHCYDWTDPQFGEEFVIDPGSGPLRFRFGSNKAALELMAICKVYLRQQQDKKTEEARARALESRRRAGTATRP